MALLDYSHGTLGGHRIHHALRYPSSCGGDVPVWEMAEEGRPTRCGIFDAQMSLILALDSEWLARECRHFGERFEGRDPSYCLSGGLIGTIFIR